MIALLVAAAALLVFAGVAKVVHPDDTARALRVSPQLVRAAAAVEAAIGAAALFTGPVLEYAVAASYTGFGVFVLVSVRRGTPLSSCGCFGEPDTPPTVSHGLVDLMLAAGSFASAGSSSRSAAARLDIPTIAVAAIVAGLGYLVMSRLPRLRASHP